MSNIHYGLEEKEKSGEAYDDSSLKSDIASLKSDVSTVKSDVTAEKLKVSTNKTAISVNKAAIAAEKTKLGNTRTLVNSLNTQLTALENTVAANKVSISGNATAGILANNRISSNTSNITRNTTTSVNANSRSKENKQAVATNKTNIATNTTGVATNKTNIATNTGKISTLESKAETNRLGIINTFTSINTYHIRIPDLSNSYKTGDFVPNIHWPSPVIQFGSIDTKTTFRLVGIVMDEDATLPANFSVSLLMRAYTATGGSSDAVLWTLILDSYKIQNKPWFCINKDVTLRTKFPTGNLKCGQLYMKHNHGSTNIAVESIVTFMVVQF